MENEGLGNGSLVTSHFHSLFVFSFHSLLLHSIFINSILMSLYGKACKHKKRMDGTDKILHDSPSGISSFLLSSSHGFIILQYLMFNRFGGSREMVGINEGTDIGT